MTRRLKNVKILEMMLNVLLLQDVQLAEKRFHFSHMINVFPLSVREGFFVA